ncbi:MAG: hypothetical protein HWN81_03625 [Candidatus Lokiarchaeota archaeon]|nr:hypothetical protein [Candidatus Lokiarchaeota archaeon]
MAIKSGIIAGIIALILTFIAEIPIYPPEDLILRFKIFASENIDFYFWGYIIDGGVIITTLIGSIPESFISLCLWFIIFFIGVSSIMASTRKAKLNNSLKLFKINILLSSIILIIYGLIIFFIILVNIASFLNVVGFGYYFTIIILILNIIALKKLNKE